jgi:hypothetical protein
LQRILTEFAKGNAVTVVPVNAELTTQEAAEFQTCRGPISSLLRSGKLPFRGWHPPARAAHRSDAAQGDQDAKQKKALDGLAAEAQKLGLDY